MLKFFYDFLPVIIFFAVYKLTGNIYNATLAIIIATGIQVALQWLKHKKLENTHKINLGLILVLGGMTLFFQDDTFIKWKPTIINWLFGLVLIGSQFIGEKNIIQRMLDGSINLPQPVWVRLNLMWATFFLVSGLLNIYVAFYYGLDMTAEERTDMWVNFKLYGLLGLTILFIIIQTLYLQRHVIIKDEESS
jgi:intracellular septation protein